MLFKPGISAQLQINPKISNKPGALWSQESEFIGGKKERCNQFLNAQHLMKYSASIHLCWCLASQKQQRSLSCLQRTKGGTHL